MDKQMNLEITDSPIASDDEFIKLKLREYNSQYVEDDGKLLSAYIRNAVGNLIAGLTGKTYYHWLHIECFWVHESERKNNSGSQLIAAAEAEAIKRGCTGATLDTFSFQALGFYEKHGYSVFGKPRGNFGKHQRYYLEKQLG